MLQNIFSMGRFTRHTALALFLTSSLLLSQCKKDDNNVPVIENSSDNQYISDSGPKVNTTLSGLVVDENQRPVSGALVEAYGESVTTDASGQFKISNIQVPANRCYLKCTNKSILRLPRLSFQKPMEMPRYKWC